MRITPLTSSEDSKNLLNFGSVQLLVIRGKTTIQLSALTVKMGRDELERRFLSNNKTNQYRKKIEIIRIL